MWVLEAPGKFPNRLGPEYPQNQALTENQRLGRQLWIFVCFRFIAFCLDSPFLFRIEFVQAGNISGWPTWYPLPSAPSTGVAG